MGTARGFGNFFEAGKNPVRDAPCAGTFLTARERQVLQLLMRGLANKEISSLLEISERTVKFHVSNALSKLQLEDRRELFSDKPENKELAARV